MSKVITFFGSPRKNGNTATIIEQIISGAKSAGAEIVTYNMNEEGIRGCQGCYYCRKNEDCSVQDNLKSMYQEIKEADGIVFGFPIYFNDIGGQSKMLVDRLFPMIADDFTPRFPGKKVITVYSQGEDDKDYYKALMEKVDAYFTKSFGWDLIERFLCPGDMYYAKYTIPQEMLDEAFEAGKKLMK